ncbi:MAG TPA: serine/threonine-protein kinase [Streptosporangiaceae bacterium]|nr:serine/threonine-protein kinase [Streptosporangiaceae bacterium]
MEELQAGDPGQVGGYQLLGRLGSGGMGVVFLGRSPGGRLVAVKVIRAELAGDPDFRARFVREVAAARRVSGIYTAPVVDAAPDGEWPWLVTGYVDGPSLESDVIGQGPMTADDVSKLARGLAEGLGAIHAAGVVHRDLKPANVLLAADGPRIIDFGISRAMEAATLTQTGMTMGSPGFMSPEQVEGREVGPASDVFSLGAVLAYAATGQNPFGDGAVAALMYRVVHGPPALDGVPEPLRPVVDWCLAKDPARRPAPAALLAHLNGEKPAALAPRPAPSGSHQPSTAASASPSALAAMDAHTEAVAHSPYSATTGPVRSRVRWWRVLAAAAAAAVVIGAIAAVALFAAHKASSDLASSHRTPPSSSASAALPAAPAPQTVVRAFIVAINAHNWPRVWQLGGKNLGLTYPAMVAGFDRTRRDQLINMTASGNTVSAHILAFETTGAVQVYALTYIVQDGAITSGQQILLTRNIARCLRLHHPRCPSASRAG